MTLDEFRASLSDPISLSAPLRALWADASGDWEAAHRFVQDDDSTEGAWVHAYLHRKEGDISNAGYWYSRAGKPHFSGSLEEEWEELAKALLAAE